MGAVCSSTTSDKFSPAPQRTPETTLCKPRKLWQLENGRRLPSSSTRSRSGSSWPSQTQSRRCSLLKSRRKVSEHLFTYAPYYDTLAVGTLSSMFELSDRQVAAIVSKMISHEELAAALDQVNSSIIFRKGVELSRLQSLALTLSDKASGLIESNERTLETRTQGTANAFEDVEAEEAAEDVAVVVVVEAVLPDNRVVRNSQV